MSFKPITVRNVEEYLLTRRVPVSFAQLECAFLCTKPNQSQRLQEILKKLVSKNLIIAPKVKSPEVHLLGEANVRLLGLSLTTDVYLHLDVARGLLREAIAENG